MPYWYWSLETQSNELQEAWKWVVIIIHILISIEVGGYYYPYIPTSMEVSDYHYPCSKKHG